MPKPMRLILLACLGGLCSVAAAQAPPAATQTAPASQPSSEAPSEKTVSTQQAIRLNGKKFSYQASAGFLPIRNDDGKLLGHMFYVAYVKDSPPATSRPITFAFNGGPGAASLWLHLGAIGPKRVVLEDDGKSLPQAVQLVDNACTWLEFTDLVFIDPLGCGYSTPAAGIDPKEYFSVEGDVRTVGEFIRLYISQEQRWLSPKYLVGESYGTTRAAGLAKHLQDRVGMNLNGLVLISSALSFEPISFGRGNELPCMLYLPSYAAVAWYHRQPSATSDVELEGLLARVQEFALTEYGPALARGDDLGDEQRERMVATLAELTGLTPPYINRSHLRIRNSDFAKELLSGRGELVGLLDGRVTGATTNPTAQGLDYDPSLFVVEGPFTQAVQDYLRRDLGFVTTRRYEFLSPKAIESWDWSTAGRGYLNVAGQLQEAMTKNTRLRVLAVAGYFDLTCGYYAQQYMFSHLQLAPSLKSHIRFVAYPAGHQVYTHEPSLKQLTAEAARFMKE